MILFIFRWIFGLKTRLTLAAVKRVVPIGFFVLLFCHTLAHVIAGLGAWWQAEHDLSERLLVYRSVDSIIEFQIPLTNKTDGTKIIRTANDGFGYRGHYYSVVSLEVRGDTLHIAGLEYARRSFWQDDLLSFLNDHLATSSDAGRKTNQLLKFLLKEYSANPASVLCFSSSIWRESVRIPDSPVAFSTRPATIHSPPPEPKRRTALA